MLGRMDGRRRLRAILDGERARCAVSRLRGARACMLLGETVIVQLHRF